jgi:hypothetical protein
MPDLFITMQQARSHLGITEQADADTAALDNADLLFKMEQAQESILTFLQSSDAWVDAYDEWTEDTVPRRVQAAILYRLGELYRFHGDDEPQYVPKWEFGTMAAYLQVLLRDLSDPAIA